MLKIHKFTFCMQVKVKFFFFFYNFLISIFSGYIMLGSWTNKPINIFNLMNKDSFWKKTSWFKKLILFFKWHKIYTYFHKPYQGMSIASFFWLWKLLGVTRAPKIIINWLLKIKWLFINKTVHLRNICNIWQIFVALPV